MNKFVRVCSTIADHKFFGYFITGTVLFIGLVIGLETIDVLVDRFEKTFQVVYTVVLWLFVAELVIKIVAHFPKPLEFFKDGWNVFDTLLVLLCFLLVLLDTEQVVLIARVLRFLRIISAMEQLRVLVSVLIRSMSGMLRIGLLTMTIIYVYGVLGHHLFHEVDPIHWSSLGVSLLTIFRIMTLEGWIELLNITMATYWWAWVYFVSLILIGTFLILNLIVAVVIQNHDEAIKEKSLANTAPPTNAELIAELHMMNKKLEQLNARFNEDQPQKTTG